MRVVHETTVIMPRKDRGCKREPIDLPHKDPNLSTCAPSAAMCGEFAPRSAGRPDHPAPFDKLTCRDRRAQFSPLPRTRPAGPATDESSVCWYLLGGPHPACRQPQSACSNAWSSLWCWPCLVSAHMLRALDDRETHTGY